MLSDFPEKISTQSAQSSQRHKALEPRDPDAHYLSPNTF
jgi:hypothetical protein